jgi:hypothetical protein
VLYPKIQEILLEQAHNSPMINSRDATEQRKFEELVEREKILQRYTDQKVKNSKVRRGKVVLQKGKSGQDHSPSGSRSNKGNSSTVFTKHDLSQRNLNLVSLTSLNNGKESPNLMVQP